MITELSESTGPCRGFRISGKVSLVEEKDWIKRIEGYLAVHEQLNVLVILEQGAGWGVHAGIEDLKWIMTHLGRINKIAIVADSATWRWLVGIDSAFAKLVGIREKFFESEHLADAWTWICK